ncbi:unnamed protein product [Onchocerca flexuosa]|uniref:BESS domain-containing protein n=1 Tax=Onchocerca flexuosa TaxID=387005 RepID=A0A183HH50_9BILA|nr:unnamed protein product [Onchocerca flexuosa]
MGTEEKLQIVLELLKYLKIFPQTEECLTSSPLLLEEHQEDSGIENNCRSSSIDDHSPAASVDFFPSIELNQLDTRNSFTSSLSPSPPNHQHYCYQHLELSSSSILSFPEKSFTHPTLSHSSTATEDNYLTPSTSKLFRTGTITKADFPEQVSEFRLLIIIVIFIVIIINDM